ncbi:unnamed protein product [Fraxinus pennsylvanica]|uniref:Uncharacterized protein n=1 Tax=Fraxinus pennsylvanica TaxID=56036 RepID=A0AAD1ZJU3_9LAMI|nr:unnamed protein product [Fraxinus pennsylvanica]
MVDFDTELCWKESMVYGSKVATCPHKVNYSCYEFATYSILYDLQFWSFYDDMANIDKRNTGFVSSFARNAGKSFFLKLQFEVNLEPEMLELLGQRDGGVGILGRRVVVGGWVKSSQEVLGGGEQRIRDKLDKVIPKPPQPSMAILQISDGSCVAGLQVVVDSSLAPPARIMPTGTCILAEGKIKNQSTLENAGGAKLEVNKALVRDPKRTTELISQLEAKEKTRSGKPIRTDDKDKFSEDFFSYQTFLTVSGLLHLESYACALGNVRTLIRGNQNEESFISVEYKGLGKEQYEWFLDLRRHGTAKCSGFTFLFDALVLYATGLNDARDAVPFLEVLAKPITEILPRKTLEQVSSKLPSLKG